MDRRQLLAVGLSLVVSWATSACDVQVGQDGDFSLGMASGRSEDSWSRQYEVQAGGRFELINVNGRIAAGPASGGAIEISAERIARASTDDAARDMLGKVEMREETGPGRVRVEVRSPRHFGPGGVEVRWTVKVPMGIVVDLRNTNGKVELSNLAGEVHARTVNGGVEGRGLGAGVIEATTVNGGVSLEVVEPLGDSAKLDLESVNGGVHLSLPSASRASVVARVTNGGIDTGSLRFEQTGEQSRRRFEGTLNGGGGSVNLRTTNGGVHLAESNAAARSESPQP